MLFGKHINRYYLKYSYALLFGIIALVFVDYFQLKIPELYQLVINGMNNGVAVIGETSYTFDIPFLLNYVCRPMIVIIVVMVIGRFLWRICFFGSAIKVETDLRAKMFDKCKDLSQEFYQRNKIGNLMSLFTNDLETVQDCFGSGILMFCDALLLGVLAIIKMTKMNMLLTFFSMIPMVIMLVGGLILGKYMQLKWEKRQEAFSSLSDFAQESFTGIAVIKAFVKEANELLSFRKLNRNNEKVNIEYTKLAVKLTIAVTLLVESVVCVILGYGGYLVYSGIFNAGQLIEFVGYFSAIVWPVMAIAQLIEMRSRGKASLKRIGELLEVSIDVKDKENVMPCKSISGNIIFKDLTFRYPGAEYDALKNISLEIKAGDNVGIIGKVGSGKTTLVDLILRTYNVPDGTLFIDGHDVNTIPIRDVRANIAYVPQDNFLFSDTIANNISFASDTDDEAEIVKYAEYADIHENIIGFADKYDTVLGERGVTVSGGQKQRISIARALMKNAPILILDDSVSAVDMKTERKIIDNLKSIRAGKTTILIAHRISTIEQMDRVIFLDDGKLIAMGSPNELVESCPEYKAMVDMQKFEDSNGKRGA